MRVLVLAMLAISAAPRAEACPRGAACVSSETRAAAAEVARPVAHGSMLHVAIAHARRTTLDDHVHLASSLKRHVVAAPGAVEMPWIWVQLRRSVYTRLPRYERVDRRLDHRFSLVLSPVVVSSPQDTIPGVGVEGGF